MGNFTREEMVGDWWLLQPVSPRLNFAALVQRFDLYLMGFLPPAHVDAVGRVVMACKDVMGKPDKWKIDEIEDSKWIHGWQKVTWTMETAPLSDPAFELLSALTGVTADSYGPYRHSTDLPPFPPLAKKE